MHRERDSRGRFIARGRSSIPTTPPTPPRTLEIPGSEIQSKESPTSSTKLVLGEKNFKNPTA